MLHDVFAVEFLKEGSLLAARIIKHAHADIHQFADLVRSQVGLCNRALIVLSSKSNAISLVDVEQLENACSKLRQGTLFVSVTASGNVYRDNIGKSISHLSCAVGQE